jgi:hypothetical protein
MSGPKVVRIVTREEIIAICEGHLARLDAALSEWVRVGRRNDCVTQEEEAAAGRKIAAFRELLRAGRFGDLQKKAPVEVAFLHEDMQRRLAKVAEAEVAARSVERRRSEAQAALFERLGTAGVSVAGELRKRIESGDPAAFSEAVEMLAGKIGEKLRNDQAALASRYREDESNDLEGHLVNLARDQNQRMAKLDLLLARLGQAADGPNEDFARRLTLVESAPEDRRPLLLDSLELDLARTVAAGRAQADLVREYALTVAELSTFDPAAARAFEAQGANDERLTELRSAIATAQARQAATARRASVMRSLAAIGYEATEGLETAWVENGNVVLRKPAQPGYGIEVSGDGTAGRMQMRIVAFDGETAADAARDRDAEALWCGDIAELESRLAKMGGGLAIERALPVGATPVKRVAAPAGSAETIAREGSSPGAKSLT